MIWNIYIIINDSVKIINLLDRYNNEKTNFRKTISQTLFQIQNAWSVMWPIYPHFWQIAIVDAQTTISVIAVVLLLFLWKVFQRTTSFISCNIKAQWEDASNTQLTFSAWEIIVFTTRSCTQISFVRKPSCIIHHTPKFTPFYSFLLSKLFTFKTSISISTISSYFF